MKTCFNCDNYKRFDEYGRMSPFGDDKKCSWGERPDPGREYCLFWENTTYDPMDGAEDEGGDDDGEVSLR